MNLTHQLELMRQTNPVGAMAIDEVIAPSRVEHFMTLIVRGADYDPKTEAEKSAILREGRITPLGACAVYWNSQSQTIENTAINATPYLPEGFGYNYLRCFGGLLDDTSAHTRGYTHSVLLPKIIGDKQTSKTLAGYLYSDIHARGRSIGSMHIHNDYEDAIRSNLDVLLEGLQSHYPRGAEMINVLKPTREGIVKMFLRESAVTLMPPTHLFMTFGKNQGEEPSDRGEVVEESHRKPLPRMWGRSQSLSQQALRRRGVNH
jgi:hypothetical protein